MRDPNGLQLTWPQDEQITPIGAVESQSSFSHLVWDSSKNAEQLPDLHLTTSADSPQGGWEEIQPNILQPHMWLYSDFSPRNPYRSLPSPGPTKTTHRELP